MRERARVAIAPSGARIVLLDASTEIAIDARHVEVFDGSSGAGMVVVQPLSASPVAAYAAIAAGSGLDALFAARLIERTHGRAVLELVPRTPWIGLERIIVRVVDEGASRGRIERALWLDGRGGWQRADLEALTYPSTLEARSIAPSPHPGARRLEL